MRGLIVAPPGGRVLPVDQAVRAKALRWGGLGMFRKRQKASEAQALRGGRKRRRTSEAILGLCFSRARRPRRGEDVTWVWWEGTDQVEQRRDALWFTWLKHQLEDISVVPGEKAAV